MANAPSTRVHYMLAVVRAIARADGVASPATVYADIVKRGERRPQVPPPGVDADIHFRREVRFARQELADAGVVIDREGQWSLQSPVSALRLSADDARSLVRENRKRRQAKAASANALSAVEQGGRRPAAPTIGPTTGPRPSAYEVSIVREDGPASTYVLRFATSDLWKIGYAADVEARLAHVNHHLPVELRDERWTIVWQQAWSNQELAYAMEQLVLSNLAERRTVFERVRCPEDALRTAWNLASATVAAAGSPAPSDEMLSATES